MGVVADFFVPGVPAPGGSKKSFVNPKTGKVVTLDDAKDNAGWRANVALFARTAYRGEPQTGPLEAVMVFYFARPKGHYGGGRNAGTVRPSAPKYPTVRPDVLKLARSTEDALTGILWADDSVTVDLSCRKRYGDTPGCRVIVATMEGEHDAER